MRVLWLSNTPGLYPSGGTGSRYNGIGWISSLQEILRNEPNIEIGFAFVSSKDLEEKHEDNFFYYPIKAKTESMVRKFAKYYGLDLGADKNSYVDELKRIIDKFKPDLIHLYGLESKLSTILGNTEIPIIVHLQGLLGPCSNAFWPVDFNKFSFLWPFSIREWLLRNGFGYEKKIIGKRALQEEKNYKKLQYAMGRTEWDSCVTSLMSPDCKYYHVDEVLRPSFYANRGKWSTDNSKKHIIVSTMSDTMYKGLDVIIKTASLLKRKGEINFEWQIIGISNSARIVGFFEKQIGVKSEDVSIKYIGVQSETQLCKTLLDSSLYVHPSYIDNSPNSVCEAQILGLPVIATNVGGVSSLIESGINGVLVPANGIYELSYHIQRILTSVKTSHNLSINAIATSTKRHEKTSIKQSLINTYNTIIEERK